MDEPRIDNFVFAQTRQEACKNVARDFIYWNALNIAKGVRELVDEVSLPYGELDLVDLYAYGHVDGFATAMELILNGDLSLQKFLKDNSELGEGRWRMGKLDCLIARAGGSQ
ncbi:MAG: hypothetical protein MUP16_00845 [Sedimentisphaerales bacterium]|nr:hypothetical protein [Sedimentisphaerales bacterium]